MQSKDELLTKLKTYLQNELGIDESSKPSDSELLRNYIIPALESSKSTLESLVVRSGRKRPGFLGKIKDKIENIVKNIALGLIEKTESKQNKFNEMIYRAVIILSEENITLKKELEDLKKQKKV